MAVIVRTTWGVDETYTAATDWDVDRGDHDLTLVSENGAEPTIVAVYASGQWLRVARVVPASTPPA